MVRQVSLGVAALSLSQLASSASSSVPFSRIQANSVVLPARKASTTGSTPEIDDQGFWFANFTIGNAQNQVILIDTGSSDLLLNPNEYKPSSASKATGKNFSITFATTNPDGSGTESLSGPIYLDTVTLDASPLSVKGQALGVSEKSSIPEPFPHDGLMGFASGGSSLSKPNWITNLCTAGALDECRFGLAYGTNNTGVQYFGNVESSVFKGNLSVAPTQGEWELNGDIAFNGQIIEKDADIITDSGTTVIFGPIKSVQKLFKAAGIKYVTTTGASASVTGYYPCNSPPQLGFAFPSASDAANPSNGTSSTSTIFNILPSALAENSTGNNCTASIHGTNSFGSSWLVGQVFFQGRYIDHNMDSETMGFANLL